MSGTICESRKEGGILCGNEHTLYAKMGSKENFREVLGAPNCRGSADTLKLQSKLSNSAAEQTGLRGYMASKVDCKGVGIVGN